MIKSGSQGKLHSGLTWITLNIFGWGAFILVATIIAWLAWQFSQNSTSGSEFLSDKLVNVIVSSVIGGLCWGAIVGMPQKSFLVRRLNLHGMDWIFATIIGFMLYLAFQVSHQYLLLLIAHPTYSSQLKIPLNLGFYFVPPLALGIAQWSVLRRYFRWSGWWIAATTLGVGGAGWAISKIAKLALVNGYNYSAGFTIAVYLIEGLAYGIATWIVLAVFANESAMINKGDSQ